MIRPIYLLRYIFQGDRPIGSRKKLEWTVMRRKSPGTDFNALLMQLTLLDRYPCHVKWVFLLLVSICRLRKRSHESREKEEREKRERERGWLVTFPHFHRCTYKSLKKWRVREEMYSEGVAKGFSSHSCSCLGLFTTGFFHWLPNQRGGHSTRCPHLALLRSHYGHASMNRGSDRKLNISFCQTFAI